LCCHRERPRVLGHLAAYPQCWADLNGGSSVRATLLILTAAAATSLQHQVVTFHGIGPVQVGASLGDASRAAGEPLVEAKDKPSGVDNCYHVRLKSSPTLLFMVENDRITRLETRDSRFRTQSGARVGQSEAEVRRIYGKRLEVMDHKYYEDGHYLIVRSADDHYAAIMETDGKNVVQINAGVWPSVGYVEGCA
jgi:hypothetical protein